MEPILHRHYNILDIVPGIPFSEIQRAFRRKAKVLHPDVNPAANAPALFRELMDAYESIRINLELIDQPQDQDQNLHRRLVVAKANRAEFRSIGDALRAARDGDTILVRPGRYSESLVLDKEVTIVGDGPAGAVEVTTSRASVVEMQTSRAFLRNLTLRTMANSNKDQHHFAVVASMGCLEMEDCDISSATLTGVVVYGELTDVTLRRCRIHHCRQAGFYAYDGGHGLLENCHLFDNGEVGVQIEEQSRLTARNCQIQKGPADGVVIEQGGQGEFNDCDISHHAGAGIRIKAGANPIFRRCRIHDCRQNGIVIHKGGLGDIEDCDIFANAWKGLRIHEGGRYLPRGMVSLHGNGRCSL